MKILVLNGSPKGDLSVTMQYVKFIQKKIPSHDFDFINVAQNIVSIEKDEKFFNEIIEKVKESNIILWATPLYVCLVPSQYKRFIELIWKEVQMALFQVSMALSLLHPFIFLTTVLIIT